MRSRWPADPQASLSPVFVVPESPASACPGLPEIELTWSRLQQHGRRCHGSSARQLPQTLDSEEAFSDLIDALGSRDSLLAVLRQVYPEFLERGWKFSGPAPPVLAA